jgi:hypothetical protein
MQAGLVSRFFPSRKDNPSDNVPKKKIKIEITKWVGIKRKKKK